MKVVAAPNPFKGSLGAPAAARAIAGAGMAQALGYRLLDAEGKELPRGGAALAALDHIDASGVDAGWREVSVDVAVDVTNPLTGPEGASAVYGPQKGATPEAIAELDAALTRFAQVVERDLGRAVADIPGAGAAGGAGAGLVAFLDARLVRGAPLVVDATGFDEALGGAAVVMSGEGRVDGQTAYGKGPADGAAGARRAGGPVVLLAGALGEGWEAVLECGVGAVLPLAEGPSSADEMRRDAEALAERAAEPGCHRRSTLPGTP